MKTLISAMQLMWGAGAILFEYLRSSYLVKVWESEPKAEGITYGAWIGPMEHAIQEGFLMLWIMYLVANAVFMIGIGENWNKLERIDIGCTILQMMIWGVILLLSVIGLNAYISGYLTGGLSVAGFVLFCIPVIKRRVMTWRSAYGEKT